MLPSSSLPVPSWRELLEEAGQPVFARRSTLRLFVALASGMVLAERGSVVAMAAAAGIAGQWRRACWFFSGASWDIDELGLAVAALIVRHLLADGEQVAVAIDGTFFRRWGKKVHEARWAYNGAAQGGKKLGYGNTWVIAAIVVRLPFCSSPVALPVLFRLWRGKGTASQVQLAAEMMKLLAAAFPGRVIHGVGDAAFHGVPLVIKGATWTTRLPAGAVLSGLKPPKTGKRGRPRSKGDTLGKCAQIAATAAWQTITVTIYGQARDLQVAVCDALWYGSFKDAEALLVLVRDPGSATSKPYDLGIFSTDRDASPAALVERYAGRWSIEPSNASGKQLMMVGDARNRTASAVERTVPFGFLIQSLTIIWYTIAGYDHIDIDARRLAQPWYRTKTEPSLTDMISKLRCTVTSEFPSLFSGMYPGQGYPEQNPDHAVTCDDLAA
jgi:hypothetical protein